MNIRIIKNAFTAILILLFSNLFAQPGGGGGGQGGGGNPPGGGGGGATGGPIDGEAVVLLMGVAGYTYLQLDKQRRNKLAVSCIEGNLLPQDNNEAVTNEVNQ